MPAAVAGGLLIAVPFVFSYLIWNGFGVSLTLQGSQALSAFLLYALILGAVITLIRFLYGCYRKGTRSRLLFGMASGLLIMIYSFVVLVISGLASVLSDIGLHLDTTFAALLVIFASVILMFNTGGEYIASIRGWREPVDATKADREALDDDEAFASERKLSPSNIGSIVIGPGEETDYEEEEIEKLNAQRAGGPIAPERPILGYEVDEEGKSLGIGSHEPEPIDLSFLKAEFSLRIGSLVKAQKSMTSGYLLMVLTPTVLVLAIISLLGVPDTYGANSLIGSMNYMLAIIAMMGIPIMVVSWANGLYPKGSYGRFVSSLIFATLLGVWFVLLLYVSDLRNALADFGITLQLERVFIIVCLIAIFFFGRAIFELIDERKLWRKSIGANVKIAPLNLKSMFLDFSLRIGKFQRGNSSALKTYVKFLVFPTIELVIIDWALEDLNLAANDVIEASVGTMFGTVLMFGIVMVIIRFVRGFYPSGSLGRVIFGLMGIPILFLFAWEILLGSGLQEALGQNHFIIDMSALILPVLIYILFITVFEMSELVTNRRRWHKKIGIQVEPYVPEKKYYFLHDFRPRYASFVAGAKKGQSVLSKYIFQRIVIVIILGAVIVSIVQYINDQLGGSETLSDIFGPILSSLSNLADVLYNMVAVLLVIAIATTALVCLQGSYRKGSFARLVLSGMVSLLSALWSYVFLGSIANGTNFSFGPKLGFLSMFTDMIPMICTILMYVFIALAGVKALLALSVYFKKREEYLGWRLSMLENEGVVGKPPLAPSVPTSDHKVLDLTAPLPIGNPQQVIESIHSESDQQPLRNCVACEREIPLDALICPFCRHDYQSMRTPPERPDETEPEVPPLPEMEPELPPP